MKTGFSLCSFSHRENPVFIVRIPAKQSAAKGPFKYYVIKEVGGKMEILDDL